ncbi:uncharacterized protein LOC108736170 isoform X2 [Agrilus planipennis]|uniref:Uncharacterized protein LOC108736170 isoform X2 n=1 Tax=Agrilus planipennis TaxID=224129 RepID=A0A1W4WU22_AGRPL|nr:uncharacterized protein LOC108736170 isoform X2 [Agrilus planipennis]
MTLAMDDIAFSDWPGQPVDLSGTNSWLPAYGFQPSHALLEQDFIGNPDADLFLHGNASQHYMYLETIQEETSDDLRSDSDLSDSRASPAGWLATDSETGSVIQLDRITLQEIDSGSERDLACPAKRRREEVTVACSDDESLSRSSSLLQFETLEKQCQDISSSSPSILSSFSFDSLERKNVDNVSPDSLDRVHSDGEPECDFYKTFKIDLPTTNNNHKRKQRNGFVYNSDSSSDSSDSSRTLEILRYDSCKSMNRLSRSFENLNFSSQKSPKEKLSTENLSEDSGYSDHLTSFMKLKSSSISNLDSSPDRTPEKEHSHKVFWNSGKSSNVKISGYDKYHFQEQNFASNFGSSCQDLTVLDKYEFGSPLIERFAKRRLAKSDLFNRTNTVAARPDTSLNLEKTASVRTKYKHETSASEPNLLRSVSCTSDSIVRELIPDEQSGYFESSVCVSSVPKDLNLVGELKERNNWTIGFSTAPHSIAAQNWDIADLKNSDDDKGNTPVKETTKLQPLDFQLDPHVPELYYDMSYKREGSYLKAMQNRVDFSDDEEPLPKNVRHSAIVEFDRRVLKTISETSLRSLTDSNPKLNMPFTPASISTQQRNVKSTPNLAECNNISKREDVTQSSQNIARKSSLVDQSSNTSDERTLTSAKSYSGSTNSKGVHFCPVVSEVNWRDQSESRTTSTEKDSTYSLSSSTPELDNEDGQRNRDSLCIMKPIAVRATPKEKQHSVSEPDLLENEERKEILMHMRELLDFPAKNTPRSAVSQPNLTMMKRRTSVIQKEVDGTLVRAYIDTDGIAYRHTHLVDGSQQSLPSTSPSGHVNSFMPRHQHYQQSDKRESENVYAAKPVSTMESVAKHRDSTSKSSRASGKLGGFFSRIASFRFSNRKNDKKKHQQQHQQPKSSDPSKVAHANQKVARKEDYIYIPLKGPDGENKKTARKDNNGVAKTSTDEVVQVVNETACIVSAKPPLPKLPPRVVGASVKRRAETSATPTHVNDAASDSRTIDSGDALPRPMEPMGLIETDLDTEVTVITSGAHAKTRSLMNLGADAPPRTLAAPQHPARPHKSMEFLLDKQNLKVVEYYI